MKVNSIKYPGVGKPVNIPKSNLGVIHLKGTPYQVGLQYGKAFSKDLVNFNDSLKNMFAETAGRFISKIVYHIALPFYALLQWCRIPRPLRKEIKGIAKGAEGLHRYNVIRLMKMIRLSALYDFMVNFALAGFSCSSFAKKDEAGNLLIGRNFDMIYDSSGTLDHSQLILYEIEGQQSFISAGPVFFNLAPTTAIIKGENGEPLFFGINNVTGPRKLFGKPTVTLLREMANQPSYQGILDLLKRSKETCAKKFLISDGTDAAMAEVVPGEMTVVREIKEGENNVVATNNYQTEKSKKFESKTELVHALNLNSWIRYRRIKRLLKEALASSGEPHELAIRILSDYFDLARNMEQTWGDNISPPYKNSEAYISQTYVSALLDYKNNLFWLGYGPFSAHGDFYGFDVNNLWKWVKSKGKEDLAFEIYEQTLDKEKLELGRTLTQELNAGKSYYKKDNLITATIHLRNVLKIDPGHIEAKLLLGAIKLEYFDLAGHGSGNISDDLREVIDIEDYYGVEPKFRRGSAFAYLLLGMYYDLQRKREKALENYKKVLNFEKENALWSEASEWASKFKNKPCKNVPSHKKMVELLL
ncbi:MAG: C45 family autoproteolytic acyltransferase/hydrolase [Candidatus Margulisiibacteriota bacterium]